MAGFLAILRKFRTLMFVITVFRYTAFNRVCEIGSLISARPHHVISLWKMDFKSH